MNEEFQEVRSHALSRSTFGNAMAIGGFSLGIVLAAAFAHVPGNSSEWASWVQAIGSILAILGAFFIGERQANASRKQAAAEALRVRGERIESIKAIVLTGARQALDMSDSIQYMESATFRAILAFPVSTLPEATVAMANVPLHDLGSAAAVTAFATMHAAMKKMVSEVERYAALSDEDAVRERNAYIGRIGGAQAIVEYCANEFAKVVK